MAFKSIAELKAARASAAADLTAAMERMNTRVERGLDDSFWQPTVDKAGNGQAIIRFMPAPPGEDVPFIRYWEHGFQGPGGWYIEKSLSSIGQADPVSDLNMELWATGDEELRKQVRAQKRKLYYVSNVYIVKDPLNTAAEGKVFRFRYGKKIYDMLHDVMHPAFETDEAINPFDMWEGANFKLRIATVDDYRNYDKSSFDSKSALDKNDAVLEKLWQSTYSLQELVAADKFKTYDELKARLDRVLGTAPKKNTTATAARKTTKTAPAADAKDDVAPWEATETTGSAGGTVDEDDDVSFFRNLARK